MALVPVEQRVDELEVRVARQLRELGDQVIKLSQMVAESTEASSSPWWARVAGVYKDDPAFDEAYRLSREYRDSLDKDFSEVES